MAVPAPLDLSLELQAPPSRVAREKAAQSAATAAYQAARQIVPGNACPKTAPVPPPKPPSSRPAFKQAEQARAQAAATAAYRAARESSTAAPLPSSASGAVHVDRTPLTVLPWQEASGSSMLAAKATPLLTSPMTVTSPQVAVAVAWQPPPSGTAPTGPPLGSPMLPRTSPSGSPLPTRPGSPLPLARPVLPSPGQIWAEPTHAVSPAMAPMLRAALTSPVQSPQLGYCSGVAAVPALSLSPATSPATGPAIPAADLAAANAAAAAAAASHARGSGPALDMLANISTIPPDPLAGGDPLAVGGSSGDALPRGLAQALTAARAASRGHALVAGLQARRGWASVAWPPLL